MFTGTEHHRSLYDTKNDQAASNFDTKLNSVKYPPQVWTSPDTVDKTLVHAVPTGRGRATDASARPASGSP